MITFEILAQFSIFLPVSVFFVGGGGVCVSAYFPFVVNLPQLETLETLLERGAPPSMEVKYVP